MGIEIERKFLVISDAWREAATHSLELRDGLLLDWRGRKVRIRLSSERGWVAYKGRRHGISRFEVEREVHPFLAGLLISLSKNTVTKTRHFVPHGKWTWHVDEFHGVLADVVLADVELDYEDERLTVPNWVGQEVTGRPEYRKARLITNAPSLAV